MRKLILLIFTLLLAGTSGTWATVYQVVRGSQVTDLSALSSSKYYVLKNNSTNLYNYYNGSSMASRSLLDNAAIVKLDYNAGNVTIQQVSTGTYYQGLVDGEVVTLGASPVSYAISEQSTGVYFLDNNSLKINTNNTGNLPKGANAVNFTGGYSQWKIYEVTVNVLNVTGVLVGPSTGTYHGGWDEGAKPADSWGAYWKSTAKTTDGTSELLRLNGETGMDTSTGDIYSGQTYTLTAPTGYVISSYTFNGTATDGDVTITPAGGSGTTITSGNNLGSDLSVTVRSQSTTFTLSGDGHITNLKLVAAIAPMPVIIANCPGYTTSGCTHSLPSAYGTFAGQTFTTSAPENLANVIITASTGLTISEQFVNGNAYGKCFKLVTAAASTDYTVTMTAPTGYVITGYYLGCSANTKDAVHTLTSADGSVSVVASAPPYNSPVNAPKVFEVTGLNTNSTYFTINTANKGNTLYLPQFYIYIAKSSEVVNDTYKVMFNGSEVASAVGKSRISGVTTTPSLPSSLQKSYCTYEYYSDVSCTTPLNSLGAAATTIYAKCTYPFTVSTSFNTATWYYATLRGKYLRADDETKDGSGRYSTNSTNGRTDEYKWAFFGNPYDNLYVMNKAQGNGKYLYQSSQPTFQTVADPTADNNALWAVSANSNGGFTLRSISGGANWYINDAGNGGNLGSWNSASGANDAGSNWVVSEVSTGDKAFLKSAIDYAQTLVEYPGVPGYPSTDGASTLSTAITTAQGVYDNASGDWVSAESTLRTAIATAKATISYIPRTDKYYTIVNARGAMVYDSSHDASYDTSNGNAKYIWYGSTTPNAADVNNLWGFILQDGNYYMYNVGKQQFASVGTGTYGATWIFSDTPAYITLDDGIADEIAAPKVRVRATIATTSSTYTMSVSTSYTGPVITYDANGDGGVPMIFAESSVDIDDEITDIMTSKVTDLTPFKEALQAVIDNCEGAVGSGLNQYESNSDYATALANAKAEKVNASATKGSLQEAQSDLEEAFSALSINLPATGKFYRIQGATSEKYLAAGLASNNKFNMTTATDATTIFYYDSNNKLTNLSSGLCNGVTTSAWAWVVGSSASTVTFKDGITYGGYAIQTATAHFYDNGDSSNSADRGGSIGDMSGENLRYRSWYLTEVTTLPITISSVGYATLYAPVSLTIPTGITAYIATLEQSDYLHLDEIEDGIIPANTGVVLAGNEGTYNFVITEEEGSAEDGLLEGTVAAIARPTDSYILATGGSGLGFYKDGASTIPGFKAYLPYSVLNNVKGFLGFNFDDEETGIENLNENLNKNKAIFNLAGQRVAKPTQGLYIVNGKKVVIK